MTEPGRRLTAEDVATFDVSPLTPWTRWLRSERATRYRLTREVILRLLGFIYLMGFWILVQQGLPLLGHDGLLPADDFVARVVRGFGSKGAAFWELPSVFFFTGISDRLFLDLAWVGVALSILVLAGFANTLVMALLWALYMSFVHVGQLWYGYGWEIQLLETGFLGIFLAPFDPRRSKARDPPLQLVWLFRWLVFRIMLGAGLIKIRGDECWRDLTCLYYHYETQPVPNPLSPVFHACPHWVQKLGVLFNHTVELVVPFFMVGPRRVRHVAGALLLTLQVVLILSGNLSFLNWLTIVPIVACFDDSLLERLVPTRWRARFTSTPLPPSLPARIAAWALVALVAGLSFGPISNLLSPHQVMNTEFNAFALVNTYGAFGSVGRERNEIVFEGTRDPTPDETASWRPYEFRCKPGDPDRRPCLMSPYHYRIDWQIWFAAMTDPDDAPWTVHLVWKLLHNDPGARSLLGSDPFPDSPPLYIRASYYRYWFAPLGEKGTWRRDKLGLWLPPLSIDDPRLRAFLAMRGWIGT